MTLCMKWLKTRPATAQLSGAVAPGAQVAVSYSGAGAGGQEKEGDS